jgi:hypothetical protein
MATLSIRLNKFGRHINHLMVWKRGKLRLNESQLVLGAGDHPEVAAPPRSYCWLSFKSGGLSPLPALDDIENDSLPFAEPLDARPLKNRHVNKHILSAASRHSG